MVKNKKILSVFLLIMIVVGVFTSCNVKEDKSFQSMEDFESAVIGVMNGSSFDLLASEYFPTAEKRYLNMPDLILNLQQEKINGILMDMGLSSDCRCGHFPGVLLAGADAVISYVF